MRHRSLPLTILGTLGVLNGIATIGLGVATAAGLRWVYEVHGVGPGRVPLASVFGSLAPHAGWILLGLGALLVVLGAGILAGRPWARWATVTICAVAALATVMELGTAAQARELGVMVFGGLKLALYVGLGAYLLSGTGGRGFARP